jgi:hypothetical protein
MHRLASFLGEYAVRFLHEIRPFERIDLITAVPLHPTRKRAGGIISRCCWRAPWPMD